MSRASMSLCRPVRHPSIFVLAWSLHFLQLSASTILVHIAVAVMRKLCVQLDTSSLPERGA